MYLAMRLLIVNLVENRFMQSDIKDIKLLFG